jgi:hypothetical protein
MSKADNDRAHEIVARWIKILDEERERLKSIFEEEKPRVDELIELVGEVRVIDICRQAALDNGYDTYKHKASWIHTEFPVW